MFISILLLFSYTLCERLTALPYLHLGDLRLTKFQGRLPIPLRLPNTSPTLKLTYMWHRSKGGLELILIEVAHPAYSKPKATVICNYVRGNESWIAISILYFHCFCVSFHLSSYIWVFILELFTYLRHRPSCQNDQVSGTHVSFQNKLLIDNAILLKLLSKLSFWGKLDLYFMEIVWIYFK